MSAVSFPNKNLGTNPNARIYPLDRRSRHLDFVAESPKWYPRFNFKPRFRGLQLVLNRGSNDQHSRGVLALISAGDKRAAAHKIPNDMLRMILGLLLAEWSEKKEDAALQYFF
jgi:hypothetical protein